MGKLLTVLGVPEAKQQKLPPAFITSEKLIDTMQGIYAQAPESPKKDVLAKAIAESVRILMAGLQPFLVDEVKEDNIKKENKKLPEEDEPKPAPTTTKTSSTTTAAPKPQAERKQKTTPPQTTPTPEPQPAPAPQTAAEKAAEEPMTCQEIKDAIKGLNLIAKMGDAEAAEIIKQLKIKLKTQNCK